MLDLVQMHKKLLWPVVRVRTQKAGGSGTIIYSRPYNGEEYETYVLTNWHVIDGAITHKEKEWDSLLQMFAPKDILEKVNVELFQYHDLSHVVSANQSRAEIVAYDQGHDLAVLRLESPLRAEYVAAILPRDRIDSLKLFHPVAVVGCSLGHDPIVNKGELTYLDEILEQKRYYMSNANSIFGNSGGALFDLEEGYLLGVPARITGIQLGFGFDVMTWMGFSVTVGRIYEFFDSQMLEFLYSDTFTSAQCFERRKQRLEEARRLYKEEKKT